MRKHQILKCPVCDTLVEVLDNCGLELTCCGPPMVPVEEKADGPGCDEHAPVLEYTEQGLRVRAGDGGHEMSDGHRILWIEVLCEGKRCRRFFKPHEKAQAFFEVSAEHAVVRLFCNRHGLWRATWRDTHSPMKDLALRALSQPPP